MQVVLLSKLLSGRDTDGFNGCEDLRVHSFNGTPVRTLKHLAKMVHGCRAAFMRFDLDHNVRPVAAVSDVVLELSACVTQAACSPCCGLISSQAVQPGKRCSFAAVQRLCTAP